MTSGLRSVFARLRDILVRHRGELSVKVDDPECYCLRGGKHPTQGTPMSVAWVQAGKGYVGFHLMTVYAFPELLDTVSPALRARMRGKSCFHFRPCDEGLFAELERLTAGGFGAFRKSGFLAPGAAGRSGRSRAARTRPGGAR